MQRDRCVALTDPDGTIRVVAEDYYYKSETYYKILCSEMKGLSVAPSSRELLEAFVVPICLEKAKKAGIPVCRWEISYGYIRMPAIAYSLSYFADPAEYSILRDEWIARQVIRHITNSGKYPFCYQPISEGAELHAMVSIFGEIQQGDSDLRGIADAVYRLFRIPLMNIVSVREDDRHYLSSLSPVKYSKLTREERGVLKRMIAGASVWET
ncbi:MAG: RimK-like ATPgrasp N-terminal domain-containing protein [Methanomicrobiales archaeon]|nr:RimK-like ATPgrasp N-terminal domain-containing protein [Methanomicrobiales archaeon]